MINKIKNKCGFMLLVLLVFQYSAHASNSGKKSEKPNIIFIMADDLSYGEIGPFGQELKGICHHCRLEYY
jgi:hypothetical protein